MFIMDFQQVSSTIGFDAGVLSFLEYLEVAPWVKNEEEINIVKNYAIFFQHLPINTI